MNAEHELPTSILGSQQRAEPTLGYRMAVVSGPGVGTTRAIEASEFRIGKAAQNDLTLPDPTVSRFHCVIETTVQGLRLRDLGSTNGTQVAGCFVESAYLSVLVPIQVGASTLKIFSDKTSVKDLAVVASSDAQMLGCSPVIRQISNILPRVAESGATILLEGETGTGKTLLAQMIHKAGSRPDGPFVVVDCGSIPAGLIESELFGHERGSFTGAVERQIGAFEAAHGGTIFLDEIGELPLEMQPKLLRALEERTFKRVGSTKSIPIRARVIAATNRDLPLAVGQGTFRADLYYRLDALRLRLPSLRDRLEDVPALVELFARRGRATVDEVFLDGLQRSLCKRQEWPGNIRELRNTVEKAILLDDFSPGGDAPTADLLATLRSPVEAAGQLAVDFEAGMSFRHAKDQALSEWEGHYLSALVRHTQGNLSRAARLAQMDRSHLRDLLKRYRIEP
jgi:DNA-binding NtrC family response regulator